MACRHIACVMMLVVGIGGLALAQAPAPGGGTPAGKPPTTGTSDVEKVERVLAARRDYQLALEQLRAHYLAAGDLERAHWAEEELVQYHRILKQAYRLELDVPPPTLVASKNFPDANELYRNGMGYKGKGWGNQYIDNMRRAELLFQQIISLYPESDKIDDAAYQLGDIYESKSYKQYRRAAQYFERCFQWNPNTQFDARLRAARLYDKYLQERTRAMELYRDVTTHETDPKHIAEAQKRMGELAAKK